MRLALTIFILTAIIYEVELKVFPIDLHRFSYIASFLFLTILIISKNYKLTILNTKQHSDWHKLSFFFLISLIYAFFIKLINFSNEITYLRIHLDYLLTINIVIPTIYYILPKKIKSDDFKLKILIVIPGFIQAFCMLLMLYSSNVQSFVFDLIEVRNSINRLDSEFNFRAIGLTGFSSYSNAVTQCTSLYLGTTLLYEKLTNKRLILTTFILFTILLSTIFAARTSILFLIPLFFLVGLHLTLYKQKYLRTNFLKILPFFLIFSTIFTILVVDSIEENSIMFSWVFEIFINIFHNNSLHTDSTDSLKSLFFIPELKTLLFGDGKYLENGEYYMKTDVGYLRIILFGGFIGSILFYTPFLFKLKLIKKYSPNPSNTLLSTLILLIFLTNIKGSIFFDGFSALKILLLYIFFQIQKTKQSI